MSDATDWIDAYLDAKLSAEDAELFCEWLRSSAGNIDVFVRHARLQWQLRDVLAGEGHSVSFVAAASARNVGKTRPGSSRQWVRRTWLAAAAVIMLCLVGSFLLRITHKPNLSTGADDNTGKTLATLISTDQAQWVDHVDRKGGQSVAGHLGLRSGNATVRFASGAEMVLTGPCEFDVLSRTAGRLSRGRLVATVPPSAKGFCVGTPSMGVVDLGTRFGLVVDAAGNSDVHVLQGLVEVSQGTGYRQQVTTGQAAHAGAGSHGISSVPFNSEQFALAAGSPDTPIKPSENSTGANRYQERFLSLWKTLHDPKNGYFSASGLPYHSRETFIIEAPDYGHETTSEALSYWLWLEAKYGHLTGDWSKLTAAWDGIERYAIPSAEDQPTNRFYNPKHPASYAPEWETPDKYPARLRQDVPVGQDPIAEELKRTYGTADVYGMHWLLDLDNWYGYGRHNDGTSAPAYINTFQRGPMESVWATVTHPSWETFRFGGPHGFLDLFIQDGNYSPQWRYTTAPDADARAVEAMYWAGQWAKQRGQQEQVSAALEKASRMGDYLRYATFDKYFKRLGSHSERDGGAGNDSDHHLIGWYYGWGGPIDPQGGWAFRIGCSHVHSGYQNPLAAWALAESDSLRPKSPHAAEDWRKSLSRQMEFYRWLQSAEGAIAGGATNSWNGRYETPPAGTPTFYGMAYDWEPVYHDPPSNDWFGFQAWTMCRVAELYFATGDKAAGALLDKWVPWATANVALNEDGTFLVPQTLRWSGQPESWDPLNPRANGGLHVQVIDRSGDVGVAASLARTLLYYSAGRKHWAQPDTAAASLARQLLDRIWAHDRDAAGVSASEPRPDYKRIFEQTVQIPANWAGKMPNGDAIHPGVKFLDLRTKYRKDPAFAEVERAYRAGKAPVFRYHRFWAQVEVALANAALAELDTGGAENH